MAYGIGQRGNIVIEMPPVAGCGPDIKQFAGRESEIRIAQARWEDFRKRMNTDPRTPPRAAGHDAP